MSGNVGIVSKSGNCIEDLYIATGDHQHLGSEIGGVYTRENNFHHSIHDIEGIPFLSRFEHELNDLPGNMGIGVISSDDAQPLFFNTSLGKYALCTQGNFSNIKELGDKYKKQENLNFRERTYDSKKKKTRYNKTEIVGQIISTGSSIIEGIKKVWEEIKGHGSINLMLMTPDGIYVARDMRGTFTVTLGQREDSIMAATETTCFDNLGYERIHELKAGEIVFVSWNEFETIVEGHGNSKICGFLYNYTALPSAIIENTLVEYTRYNTGTEIWDMFCDMLGIDLDYVTGIPDSGFGHGLGTSQASGLPFKRPLIKKTAIRSYIFGSQQRRDRAALHKIVVIKHLIKQMRILADDDSLVRNTQLRWLIAKIGKCQPQNVTLALACPPLIERCLFEVSTRETHELAARRAMADLEKKEIDKIDLSPYLDPTTSQYVDMVEWIRNDVNKESDREVVNAIIYLTLDRFLKAIGKTADRTCTYCWNAQI